MSRLLAHQLQFSFPFFENYAGRDIVRSIYHEILVDIWCFSVGKNDFNSIAAIFDLGNLHVCFWLGVLTNPIQNHIKLLAIVIKNTEVTLCQ